MKAYTEREGSAFQGYPDFTVEFRDASHCYWIHKDGERIPAVSVTSALRVINKPSLQPWAEACGAEGAAKLAALGELKDVPPEDVVKLVRLHGLGMDAKREAGADRGSVAHRVLEVWLRDGTVPNVSDFPAEHRGYVQGVCAFLLDARPKASSIERCVGSPKHVYAGRLDLRGLIDGRDCIVDLKSSRKGRVYDEAHLQTRAYADADVECGNPPPDGILIVAVGEDGGFELVECEAESGDWLNVLACHRTVGRLRSARGVRERIAKAAA